ncbi:MAG TPA: hypothetical protein VHM92_12290 [Allosphingosinicella sp.]|nr:hypothetical protein [Allosphingosinicella sp.]
MKILAGAALIAAQLLSAAPGSAAELLGDGGASEQRRGTFAGARFRVPLGAARERAPRAGLAIAPVRESRGSDGSLKTRFGPGLEFGVAGSEKPQLKLAGTPVSRLAEGRTGPDGRKQGVSTVGKVAIGVAAVTLVGAIALYVWLTSRCDDGCD